MTLNDIEEYSLRSIAVLGGNMHSQITVGNVTLPKAVLSTVKIFAVWSAEAEAFPRSKRMIEHQYDSIQHLNLRKRFPS